MKIYSGSKVMNLDPNTAMIRHSDNPNLSLWYHDNYKGLPVQTAQGPLITEYAGRLYRVVRALDRIPHLPCIPNAEPLSGMVSRRGPWAG